MLWQWNTNKWSTLLAFKVLPITIETGLGVKVTRDQTELATTKVTGTRWNEINKSGLLYHSVTSHVQTYPNI